MVAEHPKLTKASEKAVLFALKTYMDNTTGMCYPTTKQIAARASVTDRTARTVLQKAESLRIISRTFSRPKSGRGYPNYVYYPLIPTENISAINHQPQETKTQPEEIINTNQGKQFPTNYPGNYSNNYENPKEIIDRSGKHIFLSDRGEEVIIYESQINDSSGLRNVLKSLQNRYAQEKLLDWVIQNQLSEIKSWDDIRAINK